METFKTEKSLFEKTEDAIQARVAHLPPEEQKKAISEILINEYKIPKEKVEKIWEVENKSNKKAGWLYIIPIALATIGAGFFAKANYEDNNKGKTPIKTEKKYDEVKKDPEEVATIPVKEEKNKIEPVNPRWNKEVYNQLPEHAKDIYKYFAEKNPTPGKGYMFLDKKEGLQYVFNAENKIIARIPAGFGKDGGDAKNTSKDYKQGVTTTPAGIYLIVKDATPEDIKEYGELQYSLLGITVLGDRIFLGIHQTYAGHGELKKRTPKLQTPTGLDNNFSDGCINIDPNNFQKYLKPLFKGDYKEMMFVLPDEISEKNGVKFDVESLIEAMQNPDSKEMIENLKNKRQK